MLYAQPCMVRRTRIGAQCLDKLPYTVVTIAGAWPDRPMNVIGAGRGCCTLTSPALRSCSACSSSTSTALAPPSACGCACKLRCL